MQRNVVMRTLRDYAVLKGVEKVLSGISRAWGRNEKRNDRGQWRRSGAAFALGASLAAAGVFLAARLGKQLQDGDSERLRQQTGERFEQARGALGRAAQDVTARVGQAAPEMVDRVGQTVTQVAQNVGGRLEQARERLSAASEDIRSAEVDAQVSDLKQQAQSIAQEARNRAREAGEHVSEAAEDASKRLGASESLGHEARRQEPGAEQAVDLEAMIASMIPEDDNGAVTPEPGAAMPQVSNGMKVVGFEGIDLGRVKEVREDGFVLSRPQGADLLAPLDSVYKVEGTLVYLRIPADQLYRQNWERLPDEDSKA